MFRVWGKLVKHHKIIAESIYITHEVDLTPGEKILLSLEDFALTFDISRPIWFEKNSKDMKQFMGTRFYKDQFMDHIDFDYFEIEILEDDKRS